MDRSKFKNEHSKVLTFFREAFCIDGECKFVEADFSNPTQAIELNDSKRGVFYLAMVEIKTKVVKGR